MTYLKRIDWWCKCWMQFKYLFAECVFYVGCRGHWRSFQCLWCHASWRRVHTRYGGTHREPHRSLSWGTCTWVMRWRAYWNCAPGCTVPLWYSWCASSSVWSATSRSCAWRTSPRTSTWTPTWRPWCRSTFGSGGTFES